MSKVVGVHLQGGIVMESTPMQRGQAWLDEFFRLAGMPTTITVEEVQAHEDGSCWLTVDQSTLSPQQMTVLLSDGGSVLDSIQYLINTTLNMGVSPEEQQPFTVELDGYRARRQSELKQMAEEAAAQVRNTGEECELAALSSAERRQVHTFLQEHADLETFSRGQEPDRRLVVKLRE